MIPEKIHYCWFGGSPLPGHVKKCIASWEKYCPNFEIIQWNESNFDIKCHPFVQSAYKAKAWAFVSDYARLRIIYDNGGVYFDTDVELITHIDFLLQNDCFVGVQQAEYLCNTGLGFGAVRGNPVVYKMLKKYDGLVFEDSRKTEMACPYLNSMVLKEVGYQYTEKVQRLPDVTIYPTQYFDPYGGDESELCGDTISIHHYSASWMNKKTKFKRYVARIIGRKNFLRLKRLCGRMGAL